MNVQKADACLIYVSFEREIIEDRGYRELLSRMILIKMNPETTSVDDRNGNCLNETNLFLDLDR